MNIIYVNWECLGAEDLVNALWEMGHQVYIMQLSSQCHERFDEVFCAQLQKKIQEQKAKVVITFNYFPTVSKACQEAGCRYLAWIYDNPFVKAYDGSIANSCNYIGSFDSGMVEELESKGVDTIHYLPLCVNGKRMRECAAANRQRYTDHEIAFVGSFYNDKNSFYHRLFQDGDNEELQGYLDGIINAQLLVYGYNFMEECLTEDICAKIKKKLPFTVSQGSYITEEKVFSDYYLARRLAFLERKTLIEELAKVGKTFFYTGDANLSIENAVSCGILHYFKEMPILFRNARINVNITLRSIRKGIPLRAMDVMGAGGFLLTNYQEDFFRHFEADRHFVYYTSMEEAIDKAAYYLKHEDARQKIAAQACEIMEKEHTYEKRLTEVFLGMGLIR